MVSARIIPMLSYENLPTSIAWLERAFGFHETERFTDPDGTVSHAILEFEGASLMLGRPSPLYHSPKHHAQVCEFARKWSEVPYIIDGVLIEMADIDHDFARAVAAGAVLLSPLEDSEFAGRRYRVEDVEGHRWMFAQRTAQE